MVEISLDDVPLTGGVSVAQVCLNNSSYNDYELIAARDNGQEPGDLFVSIRDEQGLEIARGEYEGIPAGATLVGSDIVVPCDCVPRPAQEEQATGRP